MHAAPALLPSLSCTGAAPPPLLLRLRPAALYLAIPAVTSYPSVLVLRIKKIAHSQWVHKQLGSSRLRPRDDAQRARGEAWQGRGVRVRDYAKRGTSALGGRRSMSSAARIGLDGQRGRATEGMVREEPLELPGDAATTGAALEDGEVKVIALDERLLSRLSQFLPAALSLCPRRPIGGTLTKVIYHDGGSDTPSKSGPKGSLRLKCQVWHTKYLEHCLAQIQSHLRDHAQSRSTFRISATGGGAIKFASQLSALVDSTRDSTSTNSVPPALLETQDEMACLAAGLSILTSSHPNELYTFDSTSMYPSTNTMALPTCPTSLCQPIQLSTDPTNRQKPILLANVGTGASFVLCPSQQHQAHEAPAELEPARRVGGTPLTGTTLIGILKLLTGKQDYGEILALAATGDSRKVDLTVADVYGADYATIGLSGHRAAGFLGRIATGTESLIGASEGESAGGSESGSAPAYSLANVARSLVFAVGYNIGQQAVLQAKAHGAAREICFTGSFGGGHPLVMGALDYAVRMNGGGEFRATFLKRESFLGAIGAWALGRFGKESR